MNNYEFEAFFVELVKQLFIACLLTYIAVPIVIGSISIGWEWLVNQLKRRLR